MTQITWFELTTKIDVYVPETIKILGKLYEPSHFEDDFGDYIEYSGTIDDTTWELHIELDGEGLYIRAKVNDEIIFEDITRKEIGIEQVEFIKTVSEMIDEVISKRYEHA